jgi:hypothetical protein
MIRYGLVCDSAHEFEGWFRDSSAFDTQAAAGEISCPDCGSVAVAKALMAPSVATRESAKPAMTLASADPRKTEMVEALRRLKQHVVENSEYVGERFPEEARKIHYEESDARAIYGEASLEEAKKLIDEGVEVSPLPVLPDERH